MIEGAPPVKVITVPGFMVSWRRDPGPGFHRCDQIGLDDLGVGEFGGFGFSWQRTSGDLVKCFAKKLAPHLIRGGYRLA